MTADEILAALPADWSDRLRDTELIPITSGMSAAGVFRVHQTGLNDQYLKVGAGDVADHLRREVERTEWLAAGQIWVPRTLMRYDGSNQFAVLMTALNGPSIDCAPVEEWQPVVKSIARAFARFHAVPVKHCPFDETVSVRLSRARREIERGAVNPSHFDPRNSGVTPEALYHRLKRDPPASQDLVVVHGDATLSNLILGSDERIGFIDCGNAGKSDRYVDFAPLVAELVERFGVSARDVFLRTYGRIEWDERRALFYSDLYELF
jgi:aminoglycoside phosphotransferase